MIGMLFCVILGVAAIMAIAFLLVLAVIALILYISGKG